MTNYLKGQFCEIHSCSECQNNHMDECDCICNCFDDEENDKEITNYDKLN